MINVVYWTQSGNTMEMAKAVGEGIKEAGKEANVVEVGAISAESLKDEAIEVCKKLGAELAAL